ncbi:MAG: peptidylprolyl isomerase, partial [Sinobacterium sp.]|nr:peptidylprolyl isomerase [Sinobacterium sp.]
LKAAYDAEISSLSLEPIVQVAHILIDPALHDGRVGADTLIAEIQAKLAAGESFADTARAYSDDFGSKESGGELGTLLVDAFPVEFFDAASQLDVDQVSDVVETESGLHLIAVTNKVQPEVPSFESRQEALAIALSESNASPAFWAAVEELKDVSFNAPDLADPAELLGVQVLSSELFDRSTQNELFSNPVLLGQAFNQELITDGVNSELIELSSEHAVVLRVVKHQPEALKDLSDVKPEAKNALLDTLAQALLLEQSNDIKAKLLAGESVESVAKALKLDWQAQLSMKRSETKLPMAVSRAAFSVGALAPEQALVDTVVLSDGGSAVFVVSNIQDGKPASVAVTEKTMMQTYLARNRGALEYQALTAAAKVEADINLFR